MDGRSEMVAADQDALIIEISRLAHEFTGQETRWGADAGDLAQDIVLECLEKFRAGEWDTEREAVPALVKWLVQHRVIDQRRSRRRREERDGQHLSEIVMSPHPWMSPDVAIRERELAKLYQKALWSLTPACRDAYLLVRERGLSYDAVAKRPRDQAEHCEHARVGGAAADRAKFRSFISRRSARSVAST